MPPYISLSCTSICGRGRSIPSLLPSSQVANIIYLPTCTLVVVKLYGWHTMIQHVFSVCFTAIDRSMLACRPFTRIRPRSLGFDGEVHMPSNEGRCAMFDSLLLLRTTSVVLIFLLPFLTIGPDIKLMRERRAWLSMHMPVRVSDGLWTDLRIRSIELPLLRPRNIDHPINNSMNNMHSLGSKLSRQGLGQSPHRELASGETRKQCTTSHGCCC